MLHPSSTQLLILLTFYRARVDYLTKLRRKHHISRQRKLYFCHTDIILLNGYKFERKLLGLSNPVTCSLKYDNWKRIFMGFFWITWKKSISWVSLSASVFVWSLSFFRGIKRLDSPKKSIKFPCRWLCFVRFSFRSIKLFGTFIFHSVTRK